MAASQQEESELLAIIGNIPHSYHSRDLRNYFSQFIETKGFKCFHFRHRPEGNLTENDPKSREKDDSTTSDQPQKNKRLCCVVKVYKDRFTELIQLYDRHHWLDGNGESIPVLCAIVQISCAKSGN